MDLKEIVVVGGPLVPAKAADVSDAESQLWISFPDGYRDYITTLGEGVLGGSFVRVYPPWRILSELTEWRERLRQYWFWDKGKKILPKERALEAVIVADTVNGDELIFHRGRPDRLFVLPHESEKVFEIEGDFLTALDWVCDSGKLTKRFTERNFEPFDSRKKKPSARPAAGAEPAAADSLDSTVASVLKWSEQHGVAKAAQKSFKDWLSKYDKPIFGGQKKEVKKEKIKAAVKEQVLIFQPEKYRTPRVLTTLTLTDGETGFWFGEFHFSTQLDGKTEGHGWNLMHLSIPFLAEQFMGIKAT